MSGNSQTITDLSVRSHALAHVQTTAALLLPSFGVVVFAVTLLQVLFLSQGAQSLFRDSDTGWHVRNGESILRTSAVPRVDQFSYTRTGESWYAWEWLSDAGFAVAYRSTGLSGVALLAAVAIALTAWGVARFALSLGGNLFMTAVGTVVVLGVTSIHWLARPHIFSWLLALVFLSVVEHARRGGRRGWLYALPVVACIWANMHASFLLGPAIVFVYAVGEWIGESASKGWGRIRSNGHLRALSRRFGPSTLSSNGSVAGAFAVTALLSLLATFVTPYGWGLHEHVISYLQNDYLMDHISEFRSYSFHTPGALYVELFLLIAVLGILALIRQRAFGPALLGVGLLHIAFYSARHLPTAVVLIMPLAIAALTREARRANRFASWLDYSDRLRAIDRQVLGIVPLAMLLIAAAAGLQTLSASGAVDFNPQIFPVRAAEFLAKNNFSERVFSKDQWGGYLIYRFGGNLKVFIDGRSDFYGQQLLETYAEVADVKPSWDLVLKQYRVGLVLIPADHALAAALQLSPRWKRIYTDSVAVIFQRIG